METNGTITQHILEAKISDFKLDILSLSCLVTKYLFPHHQQQSKYKNLTNLFRKKQFLSKDTQFPK